MIHKIIEIKNCGRFVNYKPSEKDYGWNGILKRVNTIYAENGSGKTTFTQILRSLCKNDSELLEKRKSLQTKDPIKVEFITDKKDHVIYTSKKWKNNIHRIEVFDSFFSEANMYVFSLGNYDSPSDFYDIVPNGERVISEIKKWIQKRKRISNSIRTTKRYLKEETDNRKKNVLISRLDNQEKKKKNICDEIKKLEADLNASTKSVCVEYIKHVNSYLMKFNSNLEITDTNQQGHQFVYYIKVNGQDARSDKSNLPLRHVLSEGDKSAVSLSFFLSRIDMLRDLNKRIIVFDDPISSFDTRRRLMTISILSKFAEGASQFFLLSHDINFIKEFCDRNPECANLKIVWRNGSSVFVNHDIKLETMTGISKDIYTLQNYLTNGAMTDLERREVIRCIRPVIEGIFRLKFLNEFTDKEWLGDFLKQIRICDKTSPLYRLNDYYEELSDINDYCKQYHHSNPKYMEMPIFDEELRPFVQRTLKVIAYI